MLQFLYSTLHSPRVKPFHRIVYYILLALSTFKTERGQKPANNALPDAVNRQNG